MRLKLGLLSGAAVAVALGVASPADAVDTKWKGAPKFSGEDSSFKVKGRMQHEYVVSDGDVSQTSGANTTSMDYDSNEFRARRIRLGAEGSISKSFKYKIELQSKEGTTDLEDAMIEWVMGGGNSVLIGNFKPFQSLENHTSSRFISTAERSSFTEAFGFGRQLGLAFTNRGDNHTFSVGIFGDDINSADSDSSQTITVLDGMGGTTTSTMTLPDSESTSLNARFTFAPVNEDTRQAHLGIWARHRDAGDSGTLRYRAKAGTDNAPRWVQTSSFADSDTAFGIEGAWNQGPWSIQGEYAMLDADNATAGGTSPDYDGWYILGTWSLTGEGRTYKASKGAFDRPKVARPITNGGPGAWEAVVRYDVLDLSSSDTMPAFVASPTLNTNGGEQNTTVVGLNWWPINHVRFSANYVNASIDDGPYGSGDVDSFILRSQIDW